MTTLTIDRERMARLRDRAEKPFIRNEYGLWCPNCRERIDEMWPDACDCCGYPDSQDDFTGLGDE